MALFYSLPINEFLSFSFSHSGFFSLWLFLTLAFSHSGFYSGDKNLKTVSLQILFDLSKRTEIESSSGSFYKDGVRKSRV